MGHPLSACLPGLGALRSREAHDSYANYLWTEECYESVLVSRKNACQIPSSPTLRQKAAKGYQCSPQAGRRATSRVKGHKKRAERCLEVVENAYSRLQVHNLYPS